MKLRVYSKHVRVTKDKIIAGGRTIPLLILSPKHPTGNAPGVLWIHGGGYLLGMKEMVFMSQAYELVEQFGAVVVAPGYRLSLQAPYPAALDDCYEALRYLRQNAETLRVNPSQLMVGGESAGGGLTAALCMMARDRGEVRVAYQMPLYPMLDNLDTETSRDNHARVWNTRRNHAAWRLYLRGLTGDTPPYAAPSRQTDYRGLPPAYTFVSTAEPFYAETITYIENLRQAGVEAEVDIYPGLYHAFDMMEPKREESKRATERFQARFQYAMRHYFAAQPNPETEKESVSS